MKSFRRVIVRARPDQATPAALPQQTVVEFPAAAKPASTQQVRASAHACRAALRRAAPPEPTPLEPRGRGRPWRASRHLPT
jgi:hypothetical protein